MNSETAVNNIYPEILKFCDWFKKQHSENDLQYIKVSIPNSFEVEISLPNSQATDFHNFDCLFEKSVFFTPSVIEGLKNYITSSSCLKSEGFDRLEEACIKWNSEKACTETVQRKDLF